MGLGKTVQIIALWLLKNLNRAPALVVAPPTLLENWRRNFKFALTLNIWFIKDITGQDFIPR